ncbi:hypothetical protein DY000_02046756 [Brassica cretica]|uniref:Uncharacterized protein n=1 Tax=Brassica cretica TaxID=69181 RepID=A0ABQ7F499_BRACR|nr:hypothetical protein DY000_02046756 [Brassica cretica]
MACLSWSPSPPEWFILSAMEVQVAGGAAGQDGYAVCSGENSFFFALPMMDSIEQMMLIAWLSQPTFASQPARNSDQLLAEAAARELDKKKTRPDRVRLPQHISVTRCKTVPDSSRPVPSCDPIRSQLASMCN